MGETTIRLLNEISLIHSGENNWLIVKFIGKFRPSMKIAFIHLFLLSMTVPFTARTQHPTEVTVAAAADLRFAMDSLIAVFSKNDPGVTIKVVDLRKSVGSPQQLH